MVIPGGPDPLKTAVPAPMRADWLVSSAQVVGSLWSTWSARGALEVSVRLIRQVGETVPGPGVQEETG